MNKETYIWSVGSDIYPASESMLEYMEKYLNKKLPNAINVCVKHNVALVAKINYSGELKLKHLKLRNR